MAEKPVLTARIQHSPDPFAEALRLAILANGFDFNPIHHPDFAHMLDQFRAAIRTSGHVRYA